MKKRVCFVYGGDSLESDISILTALKVHQEIKDYDFPHYLVFLGKNGNFYTGNGLLKKENYLKLNDFKKCRFEIKNDKYYIKTKFFKQEFDLVILLTHGKGAEDGSLGSFFDILKIPCLYPGLIGSCISQDKYLFKNVIKSLKIPHLKSCLLRYDDFIIDERKSIRHNLNYPLIVKPCSLGSSIGVRKVFNDEELIDASIEAFKYDEKVLIEECLSNFKEYNISVFEYDSKLITSLVEEVNNSNEVLDFYQKYNNYDLNDTHIIPADIDENILESIKRYSLKIYKELDLESIVRFDFLYNVDNKKIYINELNVIPGSLSYYLYEKMDYRMVDLLKMIIDNYYINKREKDNKNKDYLKGYIETLKEK